MHQGGESPLDLGATARAARPGRAPRNTPRSSPLFTRRGKHHPGDDKSKQGKTTGEIADKWEKTIARLDWRPIMKIMHGNTSQIGPPVDMHRIVCANVTGGEGWKRPLSVEGGNIAFMQETRFWHKFQPRGKRTS